MTMSPTHTPKTDMDLDMLNFEVLRRGFDRLNPIAAAFGEPIALDDAMRQRFANTFLEEIGRPTEIDNGGDLRFDVGGRSNGDVDRPSDNSNSQFDGWVNLASVEHTIYRICSEVGLRIRGANNSQPYLTIADHAVLLANKQFAPQIVIVPNVLGLQKDEAIAAMESVGVILGAIALDNRCIECWHRMPQLANFFSSQALPSTLPCRPAATAWENPACSSDDVLTRPRARAPGYTEDRTQKKKART
jgi:hypothetical protein